MITMISGYPGSGKSTLAYTLARQCDGVVLDLDAIVGAIIGRDIHEAQPDMRVVMGVNDCMWALAEALENRGVDVYIIRSAPGVEEFEQHGRSCARVYVDTPRGVCRTRCAERGDYDEQRFERACSRVDEFVRMYGHVVRRVSGEINAV